jgi:hypothetical protein
MSATVKYPFGAADSKELSAAGAQALTIVDNLTMIDGVTNIATGDRTLNLTLDADLQVGAKLAIRSKTTATENTIFGTLIAGITVAGVAGKTITRTATFDGNQFLLDNEQID